MDGKKVIEIKCKGADTLPIDRILEFQGELKTLSKGNEKKLRNSILKFGFIAPFFVWDDKGEWRLLDGHQRLKTLLKMREEGYDIPLLPVDYIEADSEEDAKRKLLHITSQYGEFTTEGFENFTFGLDGFEDIRLTNDEFDLSFLRDDDEVKDDNYEIPDEIETDIKVGDIFQIGKHRLMCGDSTDAEMVAKLMDGQKADMVFTDPPYGVDVKGKYTGSILNDDLKDDKLEDFLKEINANLEIYCSGNMYICYEVLNSVENFNAFGKPDEIICFNKDSASFYSKNKYNRKYELIMFYENGKELYCESETNVWDAPKSSSFNNRDENGLRFNDKGNFCVAHPTTKPLIIPSRAIKNSSKEKENVLDLFGGSGSTLIACEQLNRICYMMELDPKYCQVIIDRMRALDGTIEIRRNGELYD